MFAPLQIMSPRILQKRMIYLSSSCSSTDREKLRPTILLRALRHPLLNRTLTMTIFVLWWLHHCTCRSEKQVQTDHKFITLWEKSWCPVRLKFRRVRGNQSRCFPALRKSSQETPSDREDFSSEHQQVLGNNEPHSDSRTGKIRWNHSLKNMNIKNLQKQNLKCESKNAEQIFSTVLLRDNLIPIAWKSIVLTKAMKNLEKSRPDFVKN